MSSKAAAERHTTLYVGDEPGRRVLYFQSGEGTLIVVYGAALDERLRVALADLGATSFENTQGGFICRR